VTESGVRAGATTSPAAVRTLAPGIEAKQDPLGSSDPNFFWTYFRGESESIRWDRRASAQLRALPARPWAPIVRARTPCRKETQIVREISRLAGARDLAAGRLAGRTGAAVAALRAAPGRAALLLSPELPTSVPGPVAGGTEQRRAGHQLGPLVLCTSSVPSASKPLVRLSARLGQTPPREWPSQARLNETPPRESR
jgi:hypothetical protein